MTAPGGGGDRLEVSVVADASGFAKDAQAKVDAAVKAVRARIRAEVDTQRLQAQAAAAAKRVEQQTKLQIKVGVDRKYLAESLKAALAGAAGGKYTVKVGVSVDRSQLDKALADAQKGAKVNVDVGGGQAEVKVDADTTGAETQIEGMRRRQGRPINVPVKADTRDAQKSTNVLEGAAKRMLSPFRLLGTVIGGIQPAAMGLAAAAAPGILSIGAAASQAAGAVAVLPNLLAMAAQGAGVLLAGFSGIGDAVGAMQKVSDGAGAAASASAKARQAAAKRVADAQKALQRTQTSADRTAIDGARAVADAQQKVADTVATANERVATAEKRLQAAQKASERAQQELTQARADAQRKLEDYQNQLKDAALDEESASIAVERARQRWNDTMRSPISTDLDRREADLALRQAEQNLTEIQGKNKDLQKEAAQAQAAGIEGSVNVVAARDTEVTAAQDVLDSEAELAKTRADEARNVADAQADLQRTIADTAQANADAAQSVADAQDNVAEALQAVADAASATNPAVNALTAAMAKLSPKAQEFARFVQDTLQPRLEDLKKGIQEALLPGVQAGVTAALPLLDTLKTGLEGTGTVIGKFVTDLGTMMGSPAFRGDVATIMDSNNRAMESFSGTGLNLVTIFKDLMVAAGPLLERFAAWTKTLTDSWSATTEANAENGKLAEFFKTAGDTLSTLGSILGNTASALFNFFSQGTDSGEGLLQKIKDITAKWKAWTEDPENQAKIKKFFDDLKPVAEKVATAIGKIVDILAKLGKDGGGTLDTLLTVINKLLDAINWLVDTPVGPWITKLLGLMAVVGIVTLLISKFKKLSKLFGLIGKGAGALGGLAGKAFGGGKDGKGGKGGAAGGTPDSSKAGRQEVFWTKSMPVHLTDKPTAAPGKDSGDDNTARSKPQDDTGGRRRRRGRGSTTADREAAGGAGAGKPGRVRRAAGAVGRGAGAVGRGAGAVAGAVGGIGLALGPASKAIDGFTSKAADAVNGWVDGAAAKISDWAGVDVTGAAGLATSAISGWADNAGEKVAGWVGDNGDRIGQWASTAGSKAAEWAGAVGTWAADAGSKVAGWASDAGSTVAGWASTAGSKAGEWASSLGTAAADAGSKIAGWASDAGTAVAGWGSKAGTAISGWASGAATSIGNVAGKVTDVATEFGKSTVKAGEAAGAWAVDKGGKLVSGIASVAGAVADVVKEFGRSAIKAGEAAIAWLALNGAKAAGAIADGVLAAAEWVLNIAMDANPIMLIVLAVAALVAAFIWAWNNIDGFADFFKKIFSAIGDFFKTVWDGIKSVFTGFIDWIVGVWNGLWDGIKAVAEAVWDGIKAGIAAVWEAIKTIFTTYISLVVGFWTGLWNGIKTVAEAIWNGIKAGIDGFTSAIANAFQWVKDTISGIWNGLKSALRDPLDAIINLVYNNGVVPVWNWINNLWGGDDLKPYHLPQFATGGVLPGYAPGKDTVPAMLSPGEGILVPEAVRGLGGAEGIQALNARYSSRVRGGGKPGTGLPGRDDPDQQPSFGLGGWISDRWNDATGFIGGAWDNFTDLLSQGWQIAVHAATQPIRAAAGLVPGDGDMAKGLRNGVNQWMDKLESAVGAKEKENKAGSGKTGGGWEWIFNTVKAAIPQARVNSAVRNTPDAHGRGKAVDMGFGTGPGGAGSAGLASIARFLYKNFGSSLYELIYDGVGDDTPDVKSGKDHKYDAATSAQHHNHVHAAVYDRGGRWRDGTGGFNFSGADEGVLTGRGVRALGGFDALDSLNAGVPLSVLVGGAAPSIAAAAPAGGSVGTMLAEGAVQLTVINPVGETTEQTLNDRMRRLSAMGIFATTPGSN